MSPVVSEKGESPLCQINVFPVTLLMVSDFSLKYLNGPCGTLRSH